MILSPPKPLTLKEAWAAHQATLGRFYSEVAHLRLFAWLFPGAADRLLCESQKWDVIRMELRREVIGPEYDGR